MCVPGFQPPIREIIVFKPETFPLHRWDNNSPPVPLRHKVRSKDTKDVLPKPPFRRSHNSGNSLDGSSNSLSTKSSTSEDTVPRRPPRRLSPVRSRQNPRFLASAPVGPCRRPPGRSKGYHDQLDLHEIPLKPISFDGKKIKEEIAQPLQDVVMKGCSTSEDAVNVLFAIRRPGCGQCREHGIQRHLHR